MNRQELFNHVVNHQRAQGGQCQNVETQDCCYRADGKACAAGCLILDEHYSPEFEGGTLGKYPLLIGGKTASYAYYHQNWRAAPRDRRKSYDGILTGFSKAMMVAEALVNSGVSEDDLGFVAALQEIHDEERLKDWEGCWKQLAKGNGLTMPTMESSDIDKQRYDTWLTEHYPYCKGTAAVLGYEAYQLGLKHGQEKEKQKGGEGSE